MKIIKVFNAISEGGTRSFAIVEENKRPLLFSRDLKKTAREVRRRSGRFSNLNKKGENALIFFPVESEIKNDRGSVCLLLFPLFEEEIQMFLKYYTGEKK